MTTGFCVAYYASYVALSIAITVWVGRTLSSNGLVFLIENFEGKEALARSVNHLLLVGFYLVNIGFISLMLRYGGRPDSVVDALEYLSTKVGLVVVLLGAMHFLNMYVLMRFRRSSLFRLIEPAPVTAAGAAAASPWAPSR
jgi:hypothetical protein